MHRSIIAGVLSAALVSAVDASASPGDLDPTFGIGGVVRTDIGRFDSATDLAIQPDGKIVAVGTVDQNGTRNVFVARYLENGATDAGFGNGGVVVPDRYHQVGPRLALQSDGKIVLATRGETGGGPVFLYRFDANGVSDGTFGVAGIATLPPPTGISIAGVAGVGIAPGEKIVVALRVSPASGGASVGFARFNANGTPDVTFGSGGFLNLPGNLVLPLAFIVRPDGRMLVAGFAVLPGRFFTDAFVARFDAAGTPDTSFGANGVALLQRPSNGTEFQSIALDLDGAILAGGREFGSIFGQNQWLLARLTQDGILDPAFDFDGSALYDPGPGDDVILDLTATTAGIYATGLTERSLGLPVALFREDGQLDPAFGSGGVTGLPGQFTFGASRLAVQDNGKIIAFGIVQTFEPTFNQDVYLARYEGSGCPPVSVGFDLAPGTLNLGSMGRWITGILEPQPPTLPADIDIESILLNGTVVVDPSGPTSLGDADGDGVPDLTVKFARAAVQASVEEGDAVTVTATGRIGSGCFEASDVIRVVRAHVSAPTAGSVLPPEIASEIFWEISGAHIKSVSIIASADDGATWSVVARDVPNNGRFLWTVSAPPTDQARVAVVPAGSARGGDGVENALAVSDRFVISSVLGVGGARTPFALDGPVSNPSRDLSVRFTLANAQSATLTIFDLSGRVVSSRQVGTLGPGMHVVPLGRPGTLPSGVYLVQLMQQSRRLTTRAVVMR